MNALDRWKGKVALVTGATSGIGRAVARRLVAEGLVVYAGGRREERLAELSEELGGALRPLPLDVRIESSVSAAFQMIRDECSGIDVMVNGAGLGHHESLLEGSSELWREMVETNILGLCVCTREAIQAMRGRPEGHVFHLGSLSGHRVPPGSGVYGATKYAVRSLTESLRQELVAEGLPIRVTEVSPGFVETEFHEKHFKSTERSQQLYERYKVLQPEDVADLVVHALAAPAHVAVHDILVRSIFQPS